MRRVGVFEGEPRQATEWIIGWEHRNHHLKVGSFIQLYSGEVYEVGYVDGHIITTTQNKEIHICYVDFVIPGESFEPLSDPVNHPSHYTQGRFETIEVIEEWTRHYVNGYTAYCVGNTMKYVARAPHKHASPLEDLKKARTYLDFAIRQLEDSEGE